MSDRQRFRKILVIKPSSLGDVVQSLPFLNVLRSSYPDALIHWVIAKGLEGLLEDHPMIDRLIVINKDLWRDLGRAGRTLRELRSLFRQLSAERYDLVVDLQGLLRSGLIAGATKAPLRIGFSEAREGSRFFYTRRVKGGRNTHAVDRYLKIAEELGCVVDPAAFPFPAYSEGSPLPENPNGSQSYAVIVAGARWKSKIWPAERFGSVAAELPVRSVVIGGGADRLLAEEVVAHSAGRAVSLAGQTGLKELVAVIRGACLVITNDSGPMHIAAALNIPVLAIFGPTSPERTGPYGAGHRILRAETACSPCFRRNCDTMLCMKEITSETVGEAAAAMLGSCGR